MHIQPYFEKYDYLGINISEQIFKNGLCLPSDTKITNEQLDEIINIIKGHWKNE
jgi:dTDP-4-amino-4,6-dideoxygalactose transaminase